MIFPRLSHFAVILLVLLCVVSAMGGRYEYRSLASEKYPEICISFKNARNLTDYCNHCDPMQRIYTKTTGRSTGIYHSGNMRRILCYNEKKGRFKIYKRGTTANIRNYCLKHVRHKRSRSRRHRNGLCPITQLELEELNRTKPYLKCELYQHMGAGYHYLSVEENAKYLAVRHGRVQRLIRKGRSKKVIEPRQQYRKFIIMSRTNMRNIYASQGSCGREVFP